MARSPVAHVEVFRHWRDPAPEYQGRGDWKPVVNAYEGTLLDWGGGPGDDGYLWTHLFGIQGFDWEVPPDPIAAGRGLPTDLSLSMRVELLEEDTYPYSIFDDLTGSERLIGGCKEPTWAVWSEIKRLDRSRVNGRGWRTLLAMMEVLAANFGEENVRLIFYFAT